MSLVGRRRELAAVEHLLDQAVAGIGEHLIVTGPPGAGKTALTRAAADLARSRDLPMLRVSAADLARSTGPVLQPPGTDAGSEPVSWEQLVGAPGAGEPPSLLLIDDVDRAGPEAADFLSQLTSQLTSRLGSGPTALLATAENPLNLTPELRLGGLTEPELTELLTGLSTEAVHAVWLASGGLPGPAISLAADLADLADLDPTQDALIHLALTAPSRTSFLDLDVGLIRLLETAIERPLPPTTRARVLARLARELLGDPSAVARRRELIDEAVALARMTGGPGPIAEVLDSRLHALWDPAAAHDRLSTASENVEQARRAGDGVIERRGLFWRFIALAELGELGAAEAALTAYARAGELAGDAEAAVVVLARQSMLATIRGQFDAAAALAAEVAVQGHRAGLPDTDRLSASLNGGVAMARGEIESHVDVWQSLARRMPGHFFEATAARTMAESGRDVEAGLELERLLPAVLTGSGPRWVGVMTDLAIVAARVGEPATAQAVYHALLPYQGRLVVWAGASAVTGPVDDYLGQLAIRLGRFDDAVSHLDDAAALEQRSGTLPWLVYTLLARARALSARSGEGDRFRADDDRDRARSIAERLGLKGFLAPLAPASNEWRLSRDGEDWRLDAGPETARLRDGRGLQYLRTLLAAPGQEIAALDLVAGGAGLRVSNGDPILDDAARKAFQRRLDALDELLDAADRTGDDERALAVQTEKTALLTELRRATGLGGRPRVQTDEAERARVNATRTLWTTVKRVEVAAPLVGAHLRASLHTGRLFRYQPAPGGPVRWNV